MGGESCRGTDRARCERAAAVRTAPAEYRLDAPPAECALVRADHRVWGVRRKILVAALAIRPQLEHHVPRRRAAHVSDRQLERRDHERSHPIEAALREVQLFGGCLPRLAADIAQLDELAAARIVVVQRSLQDRENGFARRCGAEGARELVRERIVMQ